MSNIDIDTLALREAAKQATQDEWVAYILPGHNGIYPARTSEGRHCGYFIDWPSVCQGRESINMSIRTYAVNCNDAWLNTEGDDISGSYVKYKDHQEVVAAIAEVRGWNACRAAMLHGAEPVSNHEELPLDYLQGQKDGLEWAAQLAEANHPQTGDWLYDDPLELAKAIRKGPDMPEFDGPTPVTPDGWISCSERMPAQDDWILIYSKHGEYMAGQVQGEYVELSDGTLSWLGNALYWMPLPEPPQEVNRG